MAVDTQEGIAETMHAKINQYALFVHSRDDYFKIHVALRSIRVFLLQLATALWSLTRLDNLSVT